MAASIAQRWLGHYVGKPGHHSPLTSPVLRSKAVLCAGQMTHLSLICGMKQ